MKASVQVVGASTWDVLFTTPEAITTHLGGKREQPVLAFPYGGKVDAEQVDYGFGGGAANVAVALAKLGLHAVITTRVGSDWRGGEVIKNLQQQGVDVSQVQHDLRETTALGLIVTSGGAHDHVAFIARGATVNLEVPRRTYSGVNWLYVTSLAAPRWHTKLKRLFAQAKAKAVNVFWNPGAGQILQARQLANLLKHVTILDVNDEEAAMLAHALKLKYHNLRDLATVLQNLGSQHVLITAGGNGAYGSNGTQRFFHKALHVKPVNTTGAGDAFGSSFLAGFIASHGSLHTALRWGMLNSSSVIQHVGAQNGLLTLKQLKAKL